MHQIRKLKPNRTNLLDTRKVNSLPLQLQYLKLKTHIIATLKSKRQTQTPHPPPNWQYQQYPSYDYSQAYHLHNQPTTQQLNQVDQSFSSGFKFDQTAPPVSSSTPKNLFQQPVVKTVPTPPPPFNPVHYHAAKPQAIPTDLSGSRIEIQNQNLPPNMTTETTQQQTQQKLQIRYIKN